MKDPPAPPRYYSNESFHVNVLVEMSDPVDLDDENLLSPDAEGRSIVPHDTGLLNVQSTADMESILLENSIMMDNSEVTDIEDITESKNEISSEALDDLQHSDNNLTQLPDDTASTILEEDVSDVPCPEEEELPPSVPIEAEFGELNIRSKIQTKTESVARDISKYFEEDGDDPFAGIGGTTQADEESEMDNEVVISVTPADTEEHEPTKTIRIRSTSESVSEECPVKFQECKGEGLKFTQSTKNLSKFFEDTTPVNQDNEGKEFFDHFAAVESGSDAKIELSSKPEISDSSPVPRASSVGTLPSQTASLNAIPPQTPPIPTGDVTPSPLHSIVPNITSQTSQEETQKSTPSIEGSFQDSEDPFSAILQSSDMDRRHDAWIPSEMTRQTLVTMVTSQGTYFPEPTHLTMPGVIMDESLGDPVYELMVRFMGDTAAAKRQTLTVDSVPQNEDGLRQLVAAECYRAAVDLTGRLLGSCGQGVGKLNQYTRHTPQSLQLWQARFQLLVKLRLYSHAETEYLAFGTLDKPDLYYEFYPDVFPGRRGSMVSYEFRLLHAELPQYLGKTQESLDRLHYMQAIVKKIQSNLAAGLAEDGSILELSTSSRQASKELWQAREVLLLYSIGNCLLHIKDYSTALQVFHQLLDLDIAHKAALYSAIGRIYLQMGDINAAKAYFDKAEKAETKQDHQAQAQAAINCGLVTLGENKFTEAHSHFQKAIELDPTKSVAVNNMAVCALYEGKLKESLTILEKLVHSHPDLYLQEAVLFNLCTLYELESSRAMAKKQGLLDLVSQYKGNGFNVACLKMA